MVRRNSSDSPTVPGGGGRREAILDLTTQVLIEEGAHGLVLRDVADRLGITHGNLQYYFPTRSDLLVATFERAVTTYTAALVDAIASAETPAAKLAAIVASGLDIVAMPESALWRMAMSMADFNAEMSEMLRTQNAAYRAVVTDALATIAPSVDESRRQSVARMIQALLDGLALQIVVDGQGAEVDRSVDGACGEFVRSVQLLIGLDGDEVPSTFTR